MNEARHHARAIKEEAEKLLDTTHIRELLAQFGKVDLGGSFAYDLMVDRDLDFGVAVESITVATRTKIASLFASQPWTYSMNMTDRVNFEPLSNPGAPRGLYLGLTIPFPKERWNIDVWFIVSDELPPNDLAEQMTQATQEQRAAILQVKYDLMKRGAKEKGVTSAEIYAAVLNKHITTTEEFLSL